MLALRGVECILQALERREEKKQEHASNREELDAMGVAFEQVESVSPGKLRNMARTR